ncbi:Cytochrome p450 [Aspergillus sclerotialis]|uniref:Cytochrome p450 n=1 Tax=Aspergillus sclerotialis TaxID=2070753 RepID=A0A3A2ZIT6_9EURO|nr:Cytochrome p450 [Aspergillus sclerotialis]
MFDTYHIQSSADIWHCWDTSALSRALQQQKGDESEQTKQRPAFIKTDFQHIGSEHAGVAADPDVEKHRAVRKVLAPAFNSRTLKEPEPALHEHMDRVIHELGEDGGKEEGVDMRHYETRQTQQLTTQVVQPLPQCLPWNWTLGNSEASHAPFSFTAAIAKTRNDPPNPIESPSNKEAPSADFLAAQASNLIRGIIPPDESEKSKEEVRGKFSSYDEIHNDPLQALPWLHAIIEESLRLHTNGAFGLPRISPGATVDGNYIPKGCVIQTSNLAITHSPQYFQEPREFHPER